MSELLSRRPRCIVACVRSAGRGLQLCNGALMFSLAVSSENPFLLAIGSGPPFPFRKRSIGRGLLLDSLDSAIRRKKRICLRFAGRFCRKNLGFAKRKHAGVNTACRMGRLVQWGFSRVEVTGTADRWRQHGPPRAPGLLGRASRRDCSTGAERRSRGLFTDCAAERVLNGERIAAPPHPGD